MHVTERQISDALFFLVQSSLNTGSLSLSCYNFHPAKHPGFLRICSYVQRPILTCTYACSQCDGGCAIKSGGGP
jgi:hypothetical protein